MVSAGGASWASTTARSLSLSSLRKDFIADAGAALGQERASWPSRKRASAGVVHGEVEELAVGLGEVVRLGPHAHLAHARGHGGRRHPVAQPGRTGHGVGPAAGVAEDGEPVDVEGVGQGGDAGGVVADRRQRRAARPPDARAVRGQHAQASGPGGLVGPVEPGPTGRRRRGRRTRARPTGRRTRRARRRSRRAGRRCGHQSARWPRAMFAPAPRMRITGPPLLTCPRTRTGGSVDVRIGVTYSPKELEVELGDEGRPRKLKAEIDAALGGHRRPLADRPPGPPGGGARRQGRLRGDRQPRRRPPHRLRGLIDLRVGPAPQT